MEPRNPSETQPSLADGRGLPLRESIEVCVPLHSDGQTVLVVVALDIPADYRPTGKGGGDMLLVPWSVNYRVFSMVAANAVLRYLDGHPLPAFVTVRSGGEQLRAARGQPYFVTQRPAEWSRRPLGVRDARNLIWFESDPSPAEVAKAEWHALDRNTWPQFWIALERRYRLSATFAFPD